jgi:hypothetical protein
VRVLDPTIISRVLLGPEDPRQPANRAELPAHVISWSGPGLVLRLTWTQSFPAPTYPFAAPAPSLQSLKTAKTTRRETASGPVVQPGMPGPLEGSGLKNVRFAKATSCLVRPEGRGFKSRPVHHHKRDQLLPRLTFKTIQGSQRAQNLGAMR